MGSVRIPLGLIFFKYIGKYMDRHYFGDCEKLSKIIPAIFWPLIDLTIANRLVRFIFPGKSGNRLEIGKNCWLVRAHLRCLRHWKKVSRPRFDPATFGVLTRSFAHYAIQTTTVSSWFLLINSVNVIFPINNYGFINKQTCSNGS